MKGKHIQDDNQICSRNLLREHQGDLFMYRNPTGTSRLSDEEIKKALESSIKRNLKFVYKEVVLRGRKVNILCLKDSDEEVL